MSSALFYFLENYIWPLSYCKTFQWSQCLLRKRLISGYCLPFVVRNWNVLESSSWTIIIYTSVAKFESFSLFTIKQLHLRCVVLSTPFYSIVLFPNYFHEAFYSFLSEHNLLTITFAQAILILITSLLNSYLCFVLLFFYFFGFLILLGGLTLKTPTQILLHKSLEISQSKDKWFLNLILSL